jgi:hypothetical protein
LTYYAVRELASTSPEIERQLLRPPTGLGPCLLVETEHDLTACNPSEAREPSVDELDCPYCGSEICPFEDGQICPTPDIRANTPI